jgi:mono/diheme cytochrome c family protein
MRTLLKWLAIVLVVLAAGGVAAWFGARAYVREPVELTAAGPASVEHGEYVFHAAGCYACHTQEGQPPLSGGPPLDTPFGTFHAPNITPHPEAGIGDWTEAEFTRALRQGVAPGGVELYPVFPYTSYTHMTDQDVRDLWAYLQTVEPAAIESPANEVPFPLSVRPLVAFWKVLFLPARALEDAPQHAEAWHRGRYIVLALTHCGQCHTPRNLFGARRTSMRLAGTGSGPEGHAIPNITPENETGIGRWSESDLAFFLQTGMTPGGDFVGGRMAEVIERSTSRMTAEDRQAIAAYVMALPPVEHVVEDNGGESGGTHAR